MAFEKQTYSIVIFKIDKNNQISPLCFLESISQRRTQQERGW